MNKHNADCAVLIPPRIVNFCSLCFYSFT